LKDYKAIGFDMDHCLVRNRVKEIFPHLCNCLYKVLIDQRGYPSSFYNFGTLERNFFMNGLVIDLKTGNILKLGEQKLVLRAYFGFKRLTQQEIEGVYGTPPTFEKFNPEKIMTNEYYCCLTHFECYFPLVFAKMLEYKKSKKDYVDQALINQIVNDAKYAVDANYEHFDKNIYLPITKFGDYYNKIIENRDRYLYTHEKMVGALKELKAKGKVVFLVTDSHYEFTEALMSHGYGENWREYFDFIIVHGSKRKFFIPNDKQFRKINISETNKLGPAVTGLKKYNMYTEGNYTRLEKNIDHLAKDPRGRILYVGDNYAHDVLTTENLKGWDAVCIMEELQKVDVGPDYDERIWGNWKYEETPYGYVPSFWYSEMVKKAEAVVPSVECDAMMDFYYERNAIEDRKMEEEQRLMHQRIPNIVKST